MSDDGRLPDLDDLDALERIVIPELEAMVRDHEPFSDEWAQWMTLLALIRNRMLFIHLAEGFKAQIAVLDERIGGLEQVIGDRTEDGVARIVAKVLAGIRTGTGPE